MAHSVQETQRQLIACALEVLADAGFALAGSGAIREHGMTQRPTNDIDLVTPAPPRPRHAFSARRASLFRPLTFYSARKPSYLHVGRAAHVRNSGLACGSEVPHAEIAGERAPLRKHPPRVGASYFAQPRIEGCG